MTDNFWIDVLICVLCSALGGLIVYTLVEFNPYGFSKVRRAVLVTFWLLFVGAIPLVIAYYFWGGMGVVFVGFLEIGLGLIFGTVIAATVEEEEK